VTKYEDFKNSRWRRSAFKNRFFGHNSAADCPISVKFCTGKQKSMAIPEVELQTINFENPRRWTTAILKIVKSPYPNQKSPDFVPWRKPVVMLV